LQLVGEGDARRVREAPLRTQAGVQHLGKGLGALDGERLQRVRSEILPVVLPPLGEGAHARAARDGEERDVVRLAAAGLTHVVGEAEPLSARLTWEVKARDLR